MGAPKSIEINGLGASLGKKPPIEIQGVSAPLPKPFPATPEKRSAAATGIANGAKKGMGNSQHLDTLARRVSQVARSVDPFDALFGELLSLIQLADEVLPDPDLEDTDDQEDGGDHEPLLVKAFVESQAHWAFDTDFSFRDARPPYVDDVSSSKRDHSTRQLGASLFELTRASMLLGPLGQGRDPDEDERSFISRARAAFPCEFALSSVDFTSFIEARFNRRDQGDGGRS